MRDTPLAIEIDEGSGTTISFEMYDDEACTQPTDLTGHTATAKVRVGSAAFTYPCQISGNVIILYIPPADRFGESTGDWYLEVSDGVRSGRWKDGPVTVNEVIE